MPGFISFWRGFYHQERLTFNRQVFYRHAAPIKCKPQFFESISICYVSLISNHSFAKLINQHFSIYIFEFYSQSHISPYNACYHSITACPNLSNFVSSFAESFRGFSLHGCDGQPFSVSTSSDKPIPHSAPTAHLASWSHPQPRTFNSYKLLFAKISVI